MAEEKYTWTDNPTESGKAVCDTDVLNDCLMHLKYDNKSGSGLEVCDIGMALYVDESKGLRRYLNGQIVDINANTQSFLDRLKQIITLYPSLLCTENEWQTAKTLSAFGQVGKFVFNYADDGTTVVSVRIPRVVNVQGLFDLGNLGLTVPAGLPNIYGQMVGDIASTTSTAGAIKIIASYNNAFWSGAQSVARGRDWEFNASDYNSIYGNSDSVQQEAIQYPYFIQIATGSETENNIVNDIELNNPFSLFDSKYSDHELHNISWLKSEGQWNSGTIYVGAYNLLLRVYNSVETVNGLSVKLSTEEYTDYDFVLNTADETFRLPIKTKLASGKAVVGNGMTLGYTNGAQNASIVGATNGTGYRAAAFGISVSSSIASGANLAGNFGLTTDETKSGIETSDSNLYLYYYVGETVQNANLIDAGRIAEALTEALAKPHIIDTYVNGASGYRIWSDGYCEQWGRTTTNTANTAVQITLVKTYKNNDFNVQVTPISSNQSSSFNMASVGNLNINNFNIYAQNSTGATHFWKTCGYLAEGEY